VAPAPARSSSPWHPLAPHATRPAACALVAVARHQQHPNPTRPALPRGRCTRALTEGASGIQVDSVILPDGEQHKNLEVLNMVFTKALEARHDRTTTFLALGGGVIGDMTGFASACYQRGVAFVQVRCSTLWRRAHPCPCPGRTACVVWGEGGGERGGGARICTQASAARPRVRPPGWRGGGERSRLASWGAQARGLPSCPGVAAAFGLAACRRAGAAAQLAQARPPGRRPARPPPPPLTR
jgi:hypothetical protein